MELQKTPLYDKHLQLKAKMVDFASFAMPIMYTSIIKEHQAVRNAVGIFDLCHMGRILVSGKQSQDFLNYVLTCNVDKMKTGKACYGLVLNHHGKVLDDVITYRLKDKFLVVCNAANKSKVLQWLLEQRQDFCIDIEDRSISMGMIAIQGKTAQVVMNKITSNISALKYYRCLEQEVCGVSAIIARTGYTGEDGFELYLATQDLEKIWNYAMELGEPEGILPIGLGARDSLRLEAAMPLYGHEISEETTPIEAGLEFAIDFDKNFIGKAELLKIKNHGVTQKLVCLEVDSKRIARAGSEIYSDDSCVGLITSGSFSPTLQKNIAMGYIHLNTKNNLHVMIGKQKYPIYIVESPFYRKNRQAG